MPNNSRNPGFDSAMAIKDNTGRWMMLMFENKFSKPSSKTTLAWREVVQKAKSTLHQMLKLGWDKEDVVLVVTSWRRVGEPTKVDIIKALETVGNYIVLTESDQRQRFGHTLSCMIDSWTIADEVRTLNKVPSLILIIRYCA